MEEDQRLLEKEQRLLEHILDRKENPTDLSLALLRKITNDFSKKRKIGQGGFGSVYKGVLGERNVAVKMIDVHLEKIDDDDKQFGREFTSLWNTNHPNVVRFLGFCSNTHQKWIERDGSREMILANVRDRFFIFEYICNGSLDKHITDELRGFEWEARHGIIMEICEGLRYIHEKTNIIHMDLKPANILLDYQDEKFIPKIADFGLSRPNKNSHTVGQCYGTLGYWAPENRDGSKTIHACDIYSLGAIIMELVTGSMEVSDKHNALRRWRHRWNKPPTPLQYQQVTRCIDIAGRCRKQEPEERPTIFEIISFLSKSESTDGQESTYMNDDMLGIEPLELYFSKEMSWSVKLTNRTKSYFAFKIERPSNQYTIRPDKGIVPPECDEYRVQITLQPHERASQVTHNADKFILQSTKVSDGRVSEHTFHAEAGKVVDEVDFMVVYKAVEEVSPKAIVSSSYEDGARRQLDRRNFHPPENFSSSRATNLTYLVRVSDRTIDVTRGAIGSLLHKLGVLHKEFNLETSVKKHADELVKMHQVLCKLSDVQEANLDDRVKLWASNVRDMSYVLEDFVDGFLVHSEPASDGSSFRELTHEIYLEKGKSHQPIGELIKYHISKQVQDMAEKCKEYDVVNTVANATPKADIEDPRFSSIYIGIEQLIGIEGPRTQLITLLDVDDHVSRLKIISIFGFGGLGKTTLAKAVYGKLQGKYHARAFVPVGQNPKVEEVLKNIIYELDNNFDSSKLDKLKLCNKVINLLYRKRYFLVIDDIWDSLEWNSIRPAFPENNNGSTVMITTRNHDVALACCNLEEEYVYRLKTLGNEYSKSLLFRRIFGSKYNGHVTARREEILKYILKICGGMPLAIINIANLLARDTSDSAWESVRKSLGATINGDIDLENMKKILDLSYIHLPDYLKTCLHHVCMYPEDREIDKHDLVRQWVAEDFIHLSTIGGLDAEDVAENYFRKLINMSMIQPGKIDYDGEVLSCRVHDILLDLIRSKSSELNFAQVIYGSRHETWESGEIRRLSVPSSEKDDSSILATIKRSVEHVRSVLIYQVSLVPYFLEFNYIRVLHLEYGVCSQVIDLTGIDRLFFLRYLKIANSGWGFIELKLPGQIGMLQQLETIDLQGVLLKFFPTDIASLPRLSHLRYDASYGLGLPDGIDRLKSLRTLVGVCVFRSSVDSIKGLGELTNLRNLAIQSNLMVLKGVLLKNFDVYMEALRSSISRLPSLRIFTMRSCISPGKLDLCGSSRTLFSHIRKLDLRGYSFHRCPEWIGQLRDLLSFRIQVIEVADGISIVAGLPSLAYFYLSTNVDPANRGEKEESIVIPGSGAFRALKHLRFRCAMASLTFQKGALPKLENLQIRFRYYMKPRFLPVGIKHLPAHTLTEISLIVQPMEAHYHHYDGGHQMMVVRLLKGAFQDAHPAANIIIHFEEDYVDELYDHHENAERVGWQENCSSEEDDKRMDLKLQHRSRLPQGKLS